MSVARKQSLKSPRMASVGMANFRSGKQLEFELERLEKERRTKLRELNQESKHFVDLKLRVSSARLRENSLTRRCSLPPVSPGRESSMMQRDCSLSPSVSSRSPSISPPKSRSPSPRPLHLRRALSSEESPIQRSPSSSPENPNRLLSKRNSTSKSFSKSLSVTETTVITLPFTGSRDADRHSTSFNALKTADSMLKNRAGLLEANTNNNSLIPQIVINDAPIKQTSETEKKSEKGSGTKVDKTSKTSIDTEDGCLNVPVRSLRRNSLPAVPTPPTYLLKMAHKESTFITDDSDVETNRYENRNRSNSVCVPYFDHLKDTPRRNSLIRKYVARRGSYKRTATTLERLIADLARGVHHRELLDNDLSINGMSPEEWEKLKECRYLRMPSKDEDVTGNQMDIEEIFSESGKQIQGTTNARRFPYKEL